MKTIQTYANEWEKNAQKDAFWAILTDLTKLGGKWDKEEFFKTGKEEIQTLLHYMQGHSELQIVQFDKCVDFGCGLGRLSKGLSHHFKQVIGIDISQYMIIEAKKYNPGIEFICNQEENLRVLSGSSIDFVYSNIVLQHMHPYFQKMYIREFARILKPNGWAVFQVPVERNMRTFKDFVKKWLGAMLPRFLKKCLINKLLKGDSDFEIEMNCCKEKEIVKVAAENGLVVKQIVWSNATHPDFNGKLRFFDRKQPCVKAKLGPFISNTYFAKKL
ncbi:MAG: class I SAM-dependent methyltransferase [Chlamydiales bacterium]|nr:class I SAM-dependent methyltransferase [Chlamydiales bacterium]